MHLRDIHTAVVTGPTGAIGHALCEKLAGAGGAVFAVCRPGTPRAGTLKGIPGAEVVFCDMAEYGALPSLIPGGADAFFHLAWSHTTGEGRNNKEAQDKNVRCALDACRAAATLGCSVFVGAGSQAEYGRIDGVLTPGTPCSPENEYGRAKLRAGIESRELCSSLGIDHIWVRILSVYGPYDGECAMIPNLIRTLLAGKEPALTPGEQIWDYLYSADAADALFAAAQKGVSGKTYVLGSGTARPLREYVETIRDLIDPALPLGFGKKQYGKNQVMRLEADVSDLCRDVGFEPKTDFRDGAEKTIEYMRSLQNG